MPLTSGTRLGPYEIISAVGAGGMGEVYKARDTRLQRTVAIKVIGAGPGDPELVRRLEHEALSASALNHPNILTVHELGTFDDTPFLATEFVEGQTLRALLGKGALPLGKALDIAMQVASALEAAHAAGLVHRDVKPENVMVRPDGYVKVLDFGLVKLTPLQQTGDEGRTVSLHTQPGMILGTVGYMAPEQVRGQPVDQRADIWSFGVVLSEMLSGRSPFAAPTTSDVIASVLEREPRSLASSGVEAPAELERIIGKSLEKDRDARYQTIKDLLIDLRRLKQQIDVAAEIKRSTQHGAPGVVTHDVRSPRIGGPLASGAAVALLLVLGFAGWWAWGTATPAPPPPARFEYWLTVQKMIDGKPYQDEFESSGQEVFGDGWRFRFNLQGREPGHFYLLNEGPAANGQTTLHLLFPTPSIQAGSTAGAGSPVRTGWAQFTEHQGIERLWIVWSVKPVPELETAIQRYMNPEAAGLVKDPGEASSIVQLLKARLGTTAVKVEETRRTLVSGSGDLIVRLAPLEHH
jgi:hypothetical protein